MIFIFKNLQKYDLLILDEFLLSPTNESERAYFLELMESRCNKKSTIFCSQWTPEGWHQRLGDGPIADAILDRIINNSYTIVLHGKSMREEYSRIK
ncbi:MAG: ATP-binding protein [Erysipelotrichaceae bacterium]|nr:ATP-binding protein [Erysipelotrichaceae bacterium]